MPASPRTLRRPLQGGFAVEGTAVLSDDMGAGYDSQLSHSVDAELISVRNLLVGLELNMSEPQTREVGRSKRLDWGLGCRFATRPSSSTHSAAP